MSHDRGTDRNLRVKHAPSWFADDLLAPPGDSRAIGAVVEVAPYAGLPLPQSPRTAYTRVDLLKYNDSKWATFVVAP